MVAPHRTKSYDQELRTNSYIRGRIATRRTDQDVCELKMTGFQPIIQAPTGRRSGLASCLRRRLWRGPLANKERGRPTH